MKICFVEYIAIAVITVSVVSLIVNYYRLTADLNVDNKTILR